MWLLQVIDNSLFFCEDENEIEDYDVFEAFYCLIDDHIDWLIVNAENEPKLKRRVESFMRGFRRKAKERIVDEVIAFVRDHCRSPHSRVMASGCSMGAYHAVNFFLKHPDVFGGTIALSGLYRLDRPEFQMSAADLPQVYFNSPISYLAGLSDSRYLDRYRTSRIIVCVGQGAWEEEAIEDTRSLDHLFREKSVPAWIDFWGHDVNHDWPWWYKQMNYFLGHLYR